MTTDPQPMTVREFITTYYRHDRLFGRGQEYGETVIASHERNYAQEGFDLISRHESKTGEVILYGNPPDYWTPDIRDILVIPAK